MNFDFIPQWLDGAGAIALGVAIVWYASQAWARLKRVEDRADDHEKHCAEMKEDIAAMKVNLEWLVSVARQGKAGTPALDQSP